MCVTKNVWRKKFQTLYSDPSTVVTELKHSPKEHTATIWYFRKGEPAEQIFPDIHLNLIPDYCSDIFTNATSRNYYTNVELPFCVRERNEIAAQYSSNNNDDLPYHVRSVSEIEGVELAQEPAPF